MNQNQKLSFQRKKSGFHSLSKIAQSENIKEFELISIVSKSAVLSRMPEPLIKTSPSERPRRFNQKFIASIYSSLLWPCGWACTHAVYLGGKSAAAGRRVGTYSSMFAEGISRDERPNIRTQQDRGGGEHWQISVESFFSVSLCLVHAHTGLQR